MNESPINLFNIDTEAFPSAKHIERHYSLDMNPGDCVYIPAYNFFQLNGKAKVQVPVGDYKPSALMISIQYRTHSDLLATFYEAIESGKLN